MEDIFLDDLEQIIRDWFDEDNCIEQINSIKDLFNYYNVTIIWDNPEEIRNFSRNYYKKRKYPFYDKIQSNF